ncbi:MAG: DMT family transporter [Thermoleophilia bacterium]
MNRNGAPASRLIGPLLALSSAAAFALSVPMGKWLLAVTTPFTLAGLLYLGAGVALTGYRWVVGAARVEMQLRPQENDRAGPPRRNAAFLAAAVVSGGIMGPLLLFWGLASTPAAVVSLLLALEVVLTALVAGLFFREHVALQVWAAVGLMVAAALLLGWEEGGLAWSWGAAAVGLATLFWALDNNLTREVAGFSATRIAQLKGLVAGSVNLALGLAVSGEIPGLQTVAVGAVVGAVSYGLSLVLFVHALRVLGSARTGSYFASAPLIAGVLSVVAFREPVEVRLVVAFCLVGVAALLMVAETHTHGHAHGEVVHSHWHWPDQDHRHTH